MAQDEKIAIVGWGSISALGADADSVWERYMDRAHHFVKTGFNGQNEWVSPLSPEAKAAIAALGEEQLKYRRLDPVIHYGIAASRTAVLQAGWTNVAEMGINIGSSRGATTALEKYHGQFLNDQGRFTDPLSSPATTLGNIAGWIATDLQTTGPAISHSVTCSTALHAIINAVVWLRSGQSDRFLAGGSEASLTPFTLAQMKAVKVYSRLDDAYPCRSLDPGKQQNTMILGEGAACFCLEKEKRGAAGGNTSAPVAFIGGIGYGTEPMKHGASLSAEASCLQRAMRMAIQGHDPRSIDVIVMHAPGTLRGDSAEMNAVTEVFGAYKPLLTSNKWKIGHSFGASGGLSLEMALLMLLHDQFIPVPYLERSQQKKPLKKILVNGVGFGGNAASVLVTR